MKKSMIFAAVAAFMLVSFSASAQFAQSSSSALWTDTSGAEKVFNTVDFTYSPAKVTLEFGLDYNMNLNGVSLSWSQYRLITDKLPLYLQYGAGVQYTWGEFSFLGLVGNQMNFLSVKVPVNAVYKLAIPNTSFAVLPYVGLGLQGYILGQSKSDSYSDFGYDEYGNYYEVTAEDGSSNLFDKDEMDGDPFNRIVLGWQIGAKVMYDRYFLGVGYEGPITRLYSGDELKVTSSQVNITLGIKF